MEVTPSNCKEYKTMLAARLAGNVNISEDGEELTLSEVNYRKSSVVMKKLVLVIVMVTLMGCENITPIGDACADKYGKLIIKAQVDYDKGIISYDVYIKRLDKYSKEAMNCY